MQLSVKNVDDKVFRKFKAESVKEGITVGKTLTMAMESWLEKTQGKKMSILNFKPVAWGKGTEKTSEEIDKGLY